MGMQIAITRKKAVRLLLLVWLAACTPEPRPWANVDSVAERLALFEQECGVRVSLPTNRSDLEAVLAQNRTHSYVRDALQSGGDGVFSMKEAPEYSHGRVVSAIVAICPSPNPRSLMARSPRFAFYIDETGKVYHVEDHSLYTGP
jgi:hypothetical protein